MIWWRIRRIKSDLRDATQAVAGARKAHEEARQAHRRMCNIVEESEDISEALRRQRPAEVFDRLLNQALGG